MNKPLVSVIIPTFKRSVSLARSIDSVLNQTYSNFEIIVVDDNHPESDYRFDTEKIMLNYEANEKIIYIKRDVNGGGAIARNAGIENAKGNYIAFLDDDDVFYENKLAEDIKFLEKGYDMIFSNIEVYNVDDDSSIIQAYKENFDYSRRGLLTKHLVDVISGTISFVFKTEKLKMINGFTNIDANQEFVLMLKAIDNNLEIGYLNQTLSKSFVDSKANRISNSIKAVDAKIKLKKIVKPFLKELKISDRRKVCFRLNFFIFYQLLKNNDLRFVKYLCLCVPYIDLLFSYTKTKNKKIVNGVMYK